MGPFSMIAESDRTSGSPAPADPIPDSPVPDKPVPATPAKRRPARPAAPAPEPVLPDNGLSDTRLPDRPLPDSRLPDNGLSSSGMDTADETPAVGLDATETDAIQQALNRIAQVSDPVERARQVSQAADIFETAARVCRNIRDRAAGELLLTGKGPTEVSNLVDVSVSTVKGVRRDLQRQGLLK